MARPVRCLGMLIGAALACTAALAPVAWAGDRYGPSDDRTDGYSYDQSRDAPDRGYDAQGRDERSSYDRQAYDHRSSDQRSHDDDRSYDRGSDMRRRDGGASYSDRRFGEADQIDPCAPQHHMAGRDCRPEIRGDRSWEDRRGGRADVYDDQRFGYDDQGYGADQEGYGRRFDDVRAIDPCVEHYRQTGRGCAGGGYERQTYGEGYLPAYPDESVWRTQSTYEGRETWVDGRQVYGEGPVDACELIHERMGDHCPYAGRRVYRDDQVVNENLPEDFFLGDGGVGPGIVDFGGGGGGGGFASGEGFADANASASASASASARVSVRLSVMAHNHQMMHHHPSMPHSCGCKKW